MKLSTMFRAGMGVLKGRLFNSPSPLFMILALTNRCNSKCNYCKIPQRSGEELTTKEIFSLFEQAVALGVQRIGLWGGEPLVREDLGEIIGYAKKLNLYVTLDTNGYLLPEKISQLQGLDHLIISFDGSEKANDANRGSGSFGKVIKALELAPAHFKTWTITVLTKNNLEEAAYISDLAKKLGFVATFQLLHHNPKMGENRPLSPEPEAYRKVLGELMAKKQQGLPIGTSINCFRHLRDWEDYSQIRKNIPGSPPCWAGKFFFNVDADGKLYPCSLLVDEVTGLDFRAKGLKAALEALAAPACNSCLATCFTEYKLLFNLDFPTILAWMLSMQRLKQ